MADRERRSLDGRRLEIWSRIASRVQDLEELLAGMEPAAWERRCAEGWAVGVVAYHVSLGLRRQARWIELVLRGRRPHAFDWERTHALNALVSRRVVRPDPTEVRRALRAAVKRWRRLLEDVTDADLPLPAFSFQGRASPIEWVAGALAPRHIDEHLRSIRAALGE